MNQRNDIIFLFENKLIDKIARSFSPSEIVKSLSFLNGLRFAYWLLYNDKWEEKLQEFAIKLLYEIREVYPEEWNSSWEYDALLGGACNITCKYDERYEAYKRAFNKAANPPPGLLIEFARCCICPGSPSISYDQAIELILKALKQAPYADGIGLLSHIYSLKNDNMNEEYWSNILKESNQQLVSPSIEPKFLVEEYLRDLNK